MDLYFKKEYKISENGGNTAVLQGFQVLMKLISEIQIAFSNITRRKDLFCNTQSIFKFPNLVF